MDEAIQDLSTREETILRGISISKGIALGKVCLVNQNNHSNLSVQKVEPDKLDEELNRLKQAIETATQQLDRIIIDVEIRVGIAESKIFVAQKMILEDPSLNEELFEDISLHHYNAEGAVIRIFDKYETKLQEVDDEYIRARATDIGEIKQRLLDTLSQMTPTFHCTGNANCRRGQNRIIVARELTPGLTIEINTDRALGFITEHGGKLSHAAILARALGIPAVSGLKELKARVLCGTDILIDGNNGQIIIWPSSETLKKYNYSTKRTKKKIVCVNPVKELKVMANINLSHNVLEAVKMKAEGIGLYRTEFEFLAQNRILDEEEQFDNYVEVLQRMGGLPVYFRLLDIGGDKGAPFLNLPEEENPYLGFRGSRLLLSRTDLLETQARALARASLYGPVYILYPMIVDLKQFLLLKEIVYNAIEDIERGEIKHGVMFEVPSACLEADDILQRADFASIGTNDLTQYLFAVDRNNELVADDYNPDKKIFWKVIEMLVNAAQKANKPLSVCGEAASNTQYLNKMLKLGIKAISISPRLIPEIRNHIKSNPVE